MNTSRILAWLKETDPQRLETLYSRADRVRRKHLGDGVHLRGLIEISNYCGRQCGYCGLRAGNTDLTRYRMSSAEVLACARQATRLGYGTVVLQSGEDYRLTVDWVTGVVRRIKQETPLAVTLSLGERTDTELAAWREAGADRYLLRFETTDPALYKVIHPTARGRTRSRLQILESLKRLGYEIGSGVMIGIPGQTYKTLANDITLFRRLDLDMIGVGPYILHPRTPLASFEPAGEEQVPNTEEMVYKVVALARLVCPEANIPSTTALATINRVNGRELGLQRGANVVMPNVTPAVYRRLYEIYPGKACITEAAGNCASCLHERIRSIGRWASNGPGSRLRKIFPVAAGSSGSEELFHAY